MTKLFFFLFCFFGMLIVNAQPMKSDVSNLPQKGVIAGKVIDQNNKQPVEYANISLFLARDSSLVTGVVTDSEGRFSLNGLRYGKYYLTVKFIGYHTETLSQVMITPKQITNNLNEIFLRQASRELEGVEIVAEKAPIIYKIDKKVVSPSSFPSASGGTAIDVLEHTPSVTVDVEGNVALRGSSNFTVLIDGRPSPFDPGDALQQIPTSSIENIEIITNPSAKYDPEGTAGIINVITKKSKLSGFSGIVNASVGSYENYASDFLINYRTDKLNVYAGANYNHRTRPGTRSIDNSNTQEDTTYHIFSSGSGDFERITQSIKTGFDFFLSKATSFSGSFTYGERDMDRTSVLSYHEWTAPETAEYFYDGLSSFVRGGDYYRFSSNLSHKFNDDGHEILAELIYTTSEQSEYSSSNQMETGILISGQGGEEKGSENELRIKADYTLPLKNGCKFEAGWQSRIEKEEGDNLSLQYDIASGQWLTQEEYSFPSSSDINIHAFYTTFSGESKKLGYQVGLRTEYTDRSIKNLESGEDFTLNRWDFFPSLHFSYNIDKQNQFMMSYARRIDRPRSHFLEPNQSYRDAYNIRAGNPDLKPEYIDSYEMGYSYRKGGYFFSTELYYRITDNKIERTRYPYDGNIMFNSFENVGKDYAFGMELMLNSRLLKFWTVNLSGNLFNYKVEGKLYGNDFSENSFNWTTRLGNTFTVTPTTRLQIDGIYVSPSVTAQGEREGFFFSNMAVKKDFLDRKLTATLTARDLLGSMQHKFTSTTPSSSSVMKFEREGPVIQLSLSYVINNFKKKRSSNRPDDEGGDSGDFF